jgi:O-antigen/teichoic acid export membrane protein
MYSVANYVAMGIGIALSIATKWILGTLGAGYYAMIKVFSSYGGLSDLGSRDAMFREVAQSLGAGDHQRAARIRDSVFSFTLISSFVAAVILFAVAVFFVHDPLLKKGVMMAGLLVFATQIYGLMLTLLRLVKKISFLSIMIVVNILGVALFSILGASLFGVLGLVMGLIIMTCLSAWFAYRFGKLQLGLLWDFNEAWRLVQIGLPMVIAGYAFQTFLTVDTIMIGKMIGYKELGFYTIALMSTQQINSLGSYTSIILQPHIQEKYGLNKNLADSRSIFIKGTDVFVYLLPVIIALVFFGVPVMVHYFLPKFILGLPSMRILIVAYYFVAASEVSGSVLFTINKQARLIPIFCAMIILAIGLNYFFIIRHGGIEGVAIATTISYFCYFAVMFYYSLKHVLGRPELIRKMLFMVFVFAYMSLMLFGIEKIFQRSDEVLGAIIKFSIFFIIFSPFILYYETKEKLFKTLFLILQSKWWAVTHRAGSEDQIN